MRPLTQTGAKQLLPIGNKPIIHYVLENIRDAGISDVVVLVGTETAAGIRANLKDGSQWGLEIQYVHQDQPLGLAHCGEPGFDWTRRPMGGHRSGPASTSWGC